MQQRVYYEVKHRRNVKEHEEKKRKRARTGERIFWKNVCSNLTERDGSRNKWGEKVNYRMNKERNSRRKKNSMTRRR